MKKFIQKPIAIALSAALLVSSLGAGAYALNQKPTETAKTETASANPSSSSKDEAVYKDETVYVLAGAVILANTAAFVGYVIEYIKQRRVIKTKPG